MKLFQKFHSVFSSVGVNLNSVYKKLICLTLVCSLLPLLAASGISYYMAYSLSKDRTIDSIQSSNKQIALNITNRMEQVESLANSISYQLYSLYETPLTPLSQYLTAFSNTKNNIASIQNTFRIFQITTFLPEECYINSGGNGIDFFPFQKLSDYRMTEEDLYDAGSSCFWKIEKDHQFPQAFSPKPKTVLTCWNAYRNIVTGSLNYAFACHIKVSEFQEMMNPSIGTDTSFSFLLDKDNTILLHPDSSQLGTVFSLPQNDLWDEQVHSFTYDSQLLVTHPLRNGSMLLITQVPLSYVRESGNFVLSFSLMTTFFIILCTVICSVWGSKTFTKRINTLSQVMKSAQGRTNLEMLKTLAPMINRPSKTKDEIDNLAATYQQMITENEKYFERILEMSVQTEKLKYQLLQSQINPHFLFNTLNSIISCQALGKVQLAQQTMSNLSQFYRHLLHDPDTLITIGEELHITELYLNLISVCRPNHITWDFQLEDGIENFLICKFVFQPFIENSVVHGITDSSQPLHIEIKICYEEEALLIQIQDNGVGIPFDKQQEIRTTLKNHIANYEQHFGIGNVNVRLTPYFSPEYPYIILEEQPECGTLFTLHLQQLL